MADDWRSFPGAPSLGTRLCNSTDVAPGAPHFLDIDGFPLLVLENASGLRAFVNACPHQFLPLNYRGDAVLSADGTRLRCSNHSAEFDAMTGKGCGGFGWDCALTPVPVKLEGNRVVIG